MGWNTFKDSGSSFSIATVTPNDTTPVAGSPVYLRVDVAGNLALIAPNGSTVTIAAAAGEYVPVGPGVIVKSAGTTATGIVAFG